MVIVSARRDTVTPTIPMIFREMVSPSENWRWGGGGGGGGGEEGNGERGRREG